MHGKGVKMLQWVEQIIIFLILSSVIMVMIPDNNYKKCFRLVSGLILIALVLKL